MDRWQYGHYARHFIVFLRQKCSDNGGISDNGGAGRGLLLLGNSLVNYPSANTRDLFSVDID